MPREKEAYRDNLERICERFPNKELLNKKDAADFLGVSRVTVEKYVKFLPCGKVSVASFARQIS